MKKTSIHLSQPFEEILATVLSLPRAHDEVFDNAPDRERELKHMLRGLYEAANGRQVETVIGFVPVAPPVAPFLKEAPFEVETQLDFLLEAMSRVIICSSDLTDTDGVSTMLGSANGQLVPGSAKWAREDQESISRFIPETGRAQLQPQGVSHG